MTATILADAITPLSLEEGLGALAGGYRLVMNSDPTRSCLAVLGAQVCLETGNFQKMHRYNPGNRKMPADWDGRYTQFRCDEIFDVATANRARVLGPCSVTPWKGGPLQRVVLVPPHPWTSFVAFASATEGMGDYVKLLATNDRYRLAWSRAYAGDAKGMATALHLAGYFTADLTPYAAGMAQIAAKLTPIAAGVVAGAPLISAADRAHLDELVASTMAQARWGIGDPAEPSRPPPAAA